MSVGTLNNNFQCTPCGTEKRTTKSLTERLISLLNIVHVWTERHRSRRALAQLDDRMLSDIGLSRSTIEEEIEKPFWQ
ncbi:MAG: DUF1127 domain-containing protein [Methylocystaceae bacterium]|nr:DUF1127 domain-containing protein [Methylocystaceae bacterium]